jgi:hypothetical protein
MSYEPRRWARRAAGSASGLSGSLALRGGLALALFVVLGAAAGCGKEGPPVPPFRAVPAPTKDLTAHQRGPRAILSFTYPQTTPAGKALEGVSAVTVFEATRPVPAGSPAPEPLDPRQFSSLAKQRLKLDAKEVTAATTGNRIDLELDLAQPFPVPPVAHFYAVKTSGPKGDASEYSNQAVLVPKTPPLPPEDVTVMPRADGILVEWVPAVQPPAPPAPAPATAPGAKPGTPAAAAGAKPGAAVPPAGAAVPVAVPSATPASPAAPPAPAAVGGFNVYRRGAQQRASYQPLHVARPDEKSHLDTSASFGQSYIYTVTTIDGSDPKIESAVRTEREIKYLDRFPPPTPTELVAIAETPTRVRLVWKPSEAADLAGYLVYRQGPAGGDFVRLTEKPVTAPGYVDASASAGQVYGYRVTAADQTGNESPPTPVVRVTTPR